MQPSQLPTYSRFIPNRFLPSDTNLRHSRVEPDLRHLNPTFTHPEKDKVVTCYILGERKIDEIKGTWDQESVTWRRVSGEAIKILGWV